LIEKINRGSTESTEPSFPSPALPGSGSMGMISARFYRAPLLDFVGAKIMIFACPEKSIFVNAIALA
jgi:hypothetical protein